MFGQLYIEKIFLTKILSFKRDFFLKALMHELNCFFCCYQILTTVLQIPVKTVEYVRMKSTTISVLVQRDTLATTVQEVTIL